MAPALIRGMAPHEAEAVGRLLVAANAEHLAAFPPSLAAGYQAELVEVEARRAWTELYVAADDDGIVGTVSLVLDSLADTRPWPPGGSVIRFLAVAPAARNRGLGERLTRLCLERARAVGATYVALHTAPFMAAARRAYERLGFERSPEHDFDPMAQYGDPDRSDGLPWGLAYILRLADED